MKRLPKTSNPLLTREYGTFAKDLYKTCTCTPLYSTNYHVHVHHCTVQTIMYMYTTVQYQLSCTFTPLYSTNYYVHLHHCTVQTIMYMYTTVQYKLSCTCTLLYSTNYHVHVHHCTVQTIMYMYTTVQYKLSCTCTPLYSENYHVHVHHCTEWSKMVQLKKYEYIQIIGRYNTKKSFPTCQSCGEDKFGTKKSPNFRVCQSCWN